MLKTRMADYPPEWKFDGDRLLCDGRPVVTFRRAGGKGYPKEYLKDVVKWYNGSENLNRALIPASMALVDIDHDGDRTVYCCIENRVEGRWFKFTTNLGNVGTQALGKNAFAFRYPIESRFILTKNSSTKEPYWELHTYFVTVKMTWTKTRGAKMEIFEVIDLNQETKDKVRVEIKQCN